MAVTNTRAKILVVDDEKPITDILSPSLQDENYQVEVANSGDDAIEVIETFRPDVVLLDIWMPGDKDGIDVLRECRPKYPQTEFIIMSGHGTIETAVKATKLGAWDFIEKPLSMDKISILIHNILLFQETRTQKNALLNKLRKNIALVGESAAMVHLKQQISRVSPMDAPVLILGEQGTGKELLAQNLHYFSPRAGRPYVDVSCATIPSELMESELFGHEKGAFAGVGETRRGKIELCEGGTLFIDEVTDLSTSIQEKLYHFMRTKKFHRMGGKEWVESSTRIIFGSTKNLEKELREHRMKASLYEAIELHTFNMKPLKERIEDIPALVLHFSESISKQIGVRLKTISSQAMMKLQAYSWPGNVRELRNFVERIYILTNGDFVDLEQLKVAGLTDVGPLDYELGGESSLKEARARFEREYILKKLEENNGNISKTSEAIGVERSHLHRKIKSYGIDV